MSQYTPAQVNIIKKMRKGWKLYRHSHTLTCLLSQNNNLNTIHYGIVNVLLRDKLLTLKRVGLKRIEYSLTDEGQTIKL